MDFIIDGNAYLNVAISVSRNIAFNDKSIGSKYYVDDIFNENQYILKEQVKIQFRNFCLNYLYSIIAPVGSKISQVHLAFDSNSWRKDFIRESFNDTSLGDTETTPTEFTYKGNRKKDNMTYLFFEYFQKEIAPVLIEKTGINYYRISGTEGDDILAYLCEKLNSDIIIYTVDGDIAQLTYSKINNIVVIYPKQQRKHKKICIPSKFVAKNTIESNIDSFFSLDNSIISESAIDQIVSALKDKEYVEYVIDPVSEVFTKIFRGDKKDNIPKMDKITPSKTVKLLELINDEYGLKSMDLLDELDETFIDFVVKHISNLNKVSNINQLRDIRSHFIFNARIIRLSSNMFPELIQNSLDDHINLNNSTQFNIKNFINIKNNPSSI